MANPKNTASLAELKERFAEIDAFVLTEYIRSLVGPAGSPAREGSG